VPRPEPTDRILRQAVARIRRPDYPAWAAQVAAAGNCAHPVRLTGRTATINTATGELLAQFDTGSQPDRVLLKACGTRRATRCATCAAVYRGDARALILAGLRGGKGISADVAGPPLVFVTLTAPQLRDRAHHPGRPPRVPSRSGLESLRAPAAPPLPAAP
jgi:hypothetical protein